MERHNMTPKHSDRIGSGPLTDSEEEMLARKRAQDNETPSEKGLREIREFNAQLAGKIMESSTEDAKSLGLKGLWALVGNSSALVIQAVVLLILLFQVRGMHTESLSQLSQINESTLRVVDKNSKALEELAGEIRWLRSAKKGSE